MNKMQFANELSLRDKFSGHMETDCEKFGMTFGCREDCPVFERGKCENQEELTEKFEKERDCGE